MIHNYGQNLGIFICISTIIFISLNHFSITPETTRFPLKTHPFLVWFDVTAVLSKWNEKLILSSTYSYVYVVWERVYSEMYGVANNVFRGLAHTLVSAVIRVICHPNPQKLQQRELHQLPVHQRVQSLYTHGSI